MHDAPSQFNQLMAQSRFGAALQLALVERAREPRSGRWAYGAGRAALALGRMREAAEHLVQAERLLPNDAECLWQNAIVEHRLGQSGRAEARLRKLIAARPTNEVDARLVLAEVLHRSGQIDSLEREFQVGGDWLLDPRATLFAARLRASADPVAAIEQLDALARGSAPAFLRRIAGFEAVKILDRTARYREAFELATFLHASTGGPFDIGGVVGAIESQKRFIDRGGRIAPRAPAVGGTAMIVALPRSGTTLLEQMLDRHPAVTGIGEYQGTQAIGDLAGASGLTLEEFSSLSRDDALVWQKSYTDGADFLRRPESTWTLDKSLHTWMCLPAIATVLPGSVMIAIERDARDTAISTFLGNFHPSSFGWTASLDSIRTVITAHRSIVPDALSRLGFAYEAIKYEDLVEDPAGHAARCLAKMGLAMHSATTAPEANTRTVLTLSHEQVRRPINRASIGRWNNYEWAFDSQWNAL